MRIVRLYLHDSYSVYAIIRYSFVLQKFMNRRRFMITITEKEWYIFINAYCLARARYTLIFRWRTINIFEPSFNFLFSIICHNFLFCVFCFVSLVLWINEKEAAATTTAYHCKMCVYCHSVWVKMTLHNTIDCILINVYLSKYIYTFLRKHRNNVISHAASFMEQIVIRM